MLTLLFSIVRNVISVSSVKSQVKSLLGWLFEGVHANCHFFDMTDFFLTGTTRGTRDKYEVWFGTAESAGPHLESTLLKLQR